jgi:hypothetical protein
MITAKLIQVEEGTALTFVDVELSDGRTVHTTAEFKSEGGKYGALWLMALALGALDIEVTA